MLLLAVTVSLVCSLFFYCQAISSGMGRRRWAFAGLLMGPFIWPMFCMKKRYES